MNRATRWLLRMGLPPVAMFLLVLLVWDRATVVFSIQRFLLPRPNDVLGAGWNNLEALGSAAMLTAAAAGCGFLASLVLGIGVACAFSQSRVFQRSCYPYAVFLQTVPIVGIAPLIVFWFGFGFQSVVIVALIISLFPIITNVTAGLTSIDRNLLELFELHGASRWQTLTKLRFPNCVPFLVTGARTSAGLSVVGAIVGEMFAGAGLDAVGLGSLIQQLNGQLNTPYLFAAILTSTVLGLVIFGSVNIFGAMILARWQGEKLMNLHGR